MVLQSTLRPSHERLLALFQQWIRAPRSKWNQNAKSTRLVATFALTISILLGTYGTRSWIKKRSEDHIQGQRLLRRNSGLRGKDGSRTIYVPYRSSSARVTIHPTKPTTFDAHRRLFLNPPRAARLGDGLSQVPPLNTKPGLNIAFVHQFLSLLSIMVPHWNSKESGLLVSQGAFLLLRTYLSLVVTRLDGEIVRDLVSGNGKGFLWGIVKWCGIGGFASYTNATIKFLQSKVSIAFRTRLTRYIHDLYLNDNLNYYKLLNLDGSIGQGADHFICNDLPLFTASAASLYSSIGKPLVDFCVFSYQLFRSLGPLALTGLLANYMITATVLRRLSPPFGKLKVVEGRREGDFRGLHARLIANAEEIAFYSGADMEKIFLDKSFNELKVWMEGIYRMKIKYNMLEDFVIKYSWSAFGYLITSLPVFLPGWGGLGGVSELMSITQVSNREHGRMKDFITNKRLMLSLADAGGRMMYSIKDLSELAGYTSRVYNLIATLHRVHASAYHHPRGAYPELFSLADIQGTIHKGFSGVRLENTPIVVPSIFPQPGDCIIDSLSFVVQPGQHLLISGPNGSGKTSIARLVAGIWPVYRGLVSRPRSIGADGIMFLPQRPYLSIGTLRDQVIYPHTEMDMRDSGRHDAELQRILASVHLDGLPAREGGWDSRKEWKVVLSGGEKQRMAFARLLYHEPAFAFVDEGTSAVSADMEGRLYELAREKGITLMTTSTRASLKKYHVWNLALGAGTGTGSEEWMFERIGTQEEVWGAEREVRMLREKVERREGLERRREEIERELRGLGREEEGRGVVEG